MENIRSAYNVGSVFRTCDSAGIDKLFLTGISPYPPHSKLNKTALGSLESVSWEYHNSSLEILKRLKDDGVKILSLESFKNAKSIYDYFFSIIDISEVTKKSKENFNDICLVFGNEDVGISKEVLEISDEILTIPMFGKKDSLNIAVSAGIAIYEFVRKKISL
ncbi:MAG: RNA methyltransferase [Patescibacteria group bacterium]